MIAAYKALIKRYALALCASAAVGTFAWFCAGSLAKYRIEQRLTTIHEELRAAQVEPNTQIDKVMRSLGSFDRSGEQCSAGQYAHIADLVKNYRFIYQAAVQLDNGKICSSYGREISSVSIGSASSRTSIKGRSYEVSSGQDVTADQDFIIVSEQSIYVWINRKILLDNLNIPQGVQLELRGPDGVSSVTPVGRGPLNLQALPPVGKLGTSPDKVYVAFAGNRDELTSVISMPLSDLTALRWKLFFGLVLMFGVLLFIAWKTQRYCTSTAVRLRKAIRANQLAVHYQPIVNLCTGDLVGAEALSRWRFKGVSVPADVFIVAAEQSDLIRELTRSVIRQVAEDYSTYLWACKNFYVTVNISAQDIQDQTFADFVASIIATYNMPASAIVFEVTERALLDQKSAAIQLHRLRACGHRIAIDDFGTGYSSLSLIESVPVDILKIDRSFIAHEKIAGKDALWRHIAKIAQALKLKVVAEGVETRQQLPHLASEGVLLAQGWLFSKELSVQALARRHFQPPMNVDPYAE